MIYRITLLIIITSLSFTVTGQPDAVSKLKTYQCPDIAYSSSIAFTEFVNKKQYDSAQQVLKYWESKCGMREPIFRAQLVIAFATEQNVDSLINEESLYFLKSYLQRAEMIKSRDFSRYDYSYPYFGFVPIGQEFDSFTVDFFKAQYTLEKPGTTNFVLCEIYGNNADTLFTILQVEEYRESSLAVEYYKLVNTEINKPDMHIACFVGAWIPTGGITKLGTHPDIGFQVGAKYRKINIDLTASFKFIRSKTPYYATRVRSDKSVVLTDKFFGGYLGVDAGYDMWKRKSHEVQALFGAGVDGFDAIDQDTVRQLKSETTWTYNFNLGIGYRYYINNSLYVGLRAKYNFVNYALNGVVDFTGNPFTIHFVVGGLSNNMKKNALDALKYKLK